MDSDYALTLDLARDIVRASPFKTHLKNSKKVAPDAEMGSSDLQRVWRHGADSLLNTAMPVRKEGRDFIQTVHYNGSTCGNLVPIKTPKNSSKADWEAFQAV